MPGTVVTAGWTLAANADAPLDKTTQAAPIEARTDSKVTRASRFWRIGKSVVECRMSNVEKRSDRKTPKKNESKNPRIKTQAKPEADERASRRNVATACPSLF
jgi:hypothetical protein